MCLGTPFISDIPSNERGMAISSDCNPNWLECQLNGCKVGVILLTIVPFGRAATFYAHH